MAGEKDKEFLEYVVKSLVDYPEDVKVERKVDEMGVLLSLVSPSGLEDETHQVHRLQLKCNCQLLW